VFAVEGVVLVGLGLAATFVPPMAGLVATLVLGWLFLMAGTVGLACTIGAARTPGFIWSLLSALAAIVAGGVLVWNPLRGLVTLTLVLTFFFIVDGALMIVLGLAHRRELSRRWAWLVVNGIIDLFLAGVIVAGLPGTLVWALGLLVGIDMVFAGAALIAMALAARKEADA
jgi:uncharacterized membrane protein HdeD (DUF308 family)